MMMISRHNLNLKKEEYHGLQAEEAGTR
jgi:hypothetical protein